MVPEITSSRSSMKDRIFQGHHPNKAVLIRRQPNWFHTRWNISHTEPEFDITVRKNYLENPLEHLSDGNFTVRSRIPACTKDWDPRTTKAISTGNSDSGSLVKGR